MKITFGTGAISAAQLADACKGTLLSGSDPNLTVCGLCTDSAEADADTAFVALRGKRVDGHDFIPNALRAGCRCVICERPPKGVAAAILAKDGETALLHLANDFRHRGTFRTVAVTGSVGKTTTKDMIAGVLSQTYRTFATPGNRNSTVGMPLSMLGMPIDTEWAVLEMGMNAFGEIERLSLAAEPDLAVITNIGTAHIGMLGSRENILRAKLEIFSGLQANGIWIRNADDEWLAGTDGKNFRTISVSAHGGKADFSAKNIRVEPERTLFDLSRSGNVEKDLCIRASGAHNVYAALFAYAVGISAGVSPEEIRAGLLSYQPNGLRQTHTAIAGVTLIEDCYNASPESMTAALDVLDMYCSSPDRRGIAVLGEMLELGERSDELHRMVGARFAKGRADLLFTIGKGGDRIAEGALENGVSSERVIENHDCEDIGSTVDALCRTIRKGDVILIKASRAVAAERVGSALKNFLQKEEGRNYA